MVIWSKTAWNKPACAGPKPGPNPSSISARCASTVIGMPTGSFVGSSNISKSALTSGVYVGLAASVFFISGSVQLQMIAQPFFWVFTGIVRGWSILEADRRALARTGGVIAG